MNGLALLRVSVRRENAVSEHVTNIARHSALTFAGTPPPVLAVQILSGIRLAFRYLFFLRLLKCGAVSWWMHSIHHFTLVNWWMRVQRGAGSLQDSRRTVAASGMQARSELVPTTKKGETTVSDSPMSPSGRVGPPVLMPIVAEGVWRIDASERARSQASPSLSFLDPSLRDVALVRDEVDFNGITITGKTTTLNGDFSVELDEGLIIAFEFAHAKSPQRAQDSAQSVVVQVVKGCLVDQLFIRWLSGSFKMSQLNIPNDATDLIAQLCNPYMCFLAV